MKELRKLDKKGYILVKVDNKWVLEHRFIVECFIKRNLKKEEKVHHINFNKQDNNLSNLFLFPNQKEHKSFENKVIQFGYTNPIKKKIENRWSTL